MARQKKKIHPKKIAGLILVLLIVVFGSIFMYDYAGISSGSNMREINVKSGATTRDIALELKSEGVIRFPTFFRIISRISGHDSDYKQGTYMLSESAGYNKIFKTLSDGSAAQSVSVKVTIPEGFELRHIADRLEELGLIDRSEFYREIEHGHFNYPFVDALPFRENRLEGYLFPDTYEFLKGESAHNIINAMLARFDEVVYTQENKARAKELDMTFDEMLTFASIVEREAMGDIDRKNVSSVFHNRLKSSDYPYLQSCATVQYILKERKTVLSQADTKIKSPYNTYNNKGLPPGPIASPGAKSIEATLYPNDTEYLFFVLGSDGVHHFSKTFDEHLSYGG